METSKISDFFGILKNSSKKLDKVFLIFVSAFIGYLSCEFYHLADRLRSEKRTRTINETSIALNEKGELLLIDRKTGDFIVYQDSVGISIFNHYAKDLQSSYKKQN
jgi:hypothetical protein